MSVFVSTEFHSTPIGDWGQATSLFILEQIRLSVKSHGTVTSRLRHGYGSEFILFLYMAWH